jgi:mannitol 2-dehydrogenase
VPPLRAAALPELDAAVAVPRYDRGRVRVGIVHLGVGGFHRSHQAAYVDDLMNRGEALDWGICGVGVLPADRRMRDVLTRQDHLWTLLVRHPDGAVDARVIGSMAEYLLAPDDPGAVVERMADPAVRIVSLTVTEGGYNITADGGFDAGNPDIVADLAEPETPRTAFGLVAEALRRRRDRGIAPFTVLSCDNVPHNGDVARRSFAAFAALRDPGLGEWTAREVSFPNCMVDRITPATTDADRAELAARFGVEDEWPVVCEPFTQWVLEDAFGAGRPPLEDAGVQMTSDVGPYELMKLRLLNAGHQVLGHVGRLAGLTYVHEACRDPLFRDLLVGYWRDEGVPTLGPVPGIDLAHSEADLLERFGSPAVLDTLARLCTDASDRIPKFLLPVVRANLASGREIRRAVLVLAAWARSFCGADDTGRPIEIADARRDALAAAARRQEEDPLAFVRDPAVFGDLALDERFAAAYRSALDSLRERGTRATVAALAR